MDEVLDANAFRGDGGVLGQRRAEPGILTAEVVVVASKAHGMLRSAERLP